MDFLGWIAGYISDGIMGVSGGNFIMIFLMLLFGLAYILTTAGISMPFATLISFFVLGVLSTVIDNPNDPFLGTDSSGLVRTIFLILVIMGGVLLWHLFFKKSQAGSG